MNLEVALAIFEFVVLLLAISIHDSAQAWLAAKLGDPTAKMLGRISLNPMQHYDVFGTLLWPAVLVFIYHSSLLLGWGKPIPITSQNFRRGKDEMLVYLAGPVAHLAAAAVCLVLLAVLKHTLPGAAASLAVAEVLGRYGALVVSPADLPPVFPVLLFLYYGILVNLLLFAFNLVPLPSLDGGKVLRYFLSYNAQRTYDNIGIYLMIGFFLVGFRVIYAIFVPTLAVFQGVLNAM